MITQTGKKEASPPFPLALDEGGFEEEAAGGGKPCAEGTFSCCCSNCCCRSCSRMADRAGKEEERGMLPSLLFACPSCVLLPFEGASVPMRFTRYTLGWPSRLCVFYGSVASDAQRSGQWLLMHACVAMRVPPVLSRADQIKKRTSDCGSVNWMSRASYCPSSCQTGCPCQSESTLSLRRTPHRTARSLRGQLCV